MTVRTSAESLYSALCEVADKRPHRLALRGDDGEFTFTELVQAVNGASQVLQDNGIRAGDRVLIMLPNSVAFAAMVFGAMRLGAVPTPLDHRLKAREVADVVGALQPEGLVCDESLQRRVAGSNMVLIVVGDMSARGWADRSSRRLPKHRSSSGSDIAAIFCTSGSSGSPKLVEHTHRSLAASTEGLRQRHEEFFRGGVRNVARRIASMIFRYRRRVLRSIVRSQVWMTPMAFSTIAGFSLLTQCLLTGQTMVTMRRFHPRRFLQVIEEARVTTVALTPTLARMIVRLPDARSYDTSSLLVVGLGGSSAPPKLIEDVRGMFGCAVAIGYGSTEVAGGILSTDLLDPEEAQASTVGRPFRGVSVRIVDESGYALPEGQEGELQCRAPGIMRGYLDDVSDSPVDVSGWYSTGDLALVDSEGRVHILGRRDDLIIRAGKNVHPAEVERCISEMVGVDDVAVVGVDLEAGDEPEIGAFIVPSTAAPTESAEVFSYCRRQLASWKVPTKVFFVKDLPRTPEGKLQRFALKKSTLWES